MNTTIPHRAVAVATIACLVAAAMFLMAAATTLADSLSSSVVRLAPQVGEGEPSEHTVGDVPTQIYEAPLHRVVFVKVELLSGGETHLFTRDVANRYHGDGDLAVLKKPNDAWRGSLGDGRRLFAVVQR